MSRGTELEKIQPCLGNPIGGVCVCVCVCVRVCAGTEKKRRSKETVSEGSWGQTTASALEVGRGTSDSRNSLTQQGRLSICTA